MGKLIVVVVVMLAACSQQHEAISPLPATDQTRMSHARHSQIACGECHRGDARPGSQDHEPCDRGECHGKEFTGPPGEFCSACHTRVASAHAGCGSATAGSAAEWRCGSIAAPLRNYPDDDSYRAEPATLSHKIHLDAGRMESRAGFHVACIDCHVRDSELAHPDHAACARCHAAEVKLTGAPAMGDCVRCHSTTTRLRARGRLIRDDLKFEHTIHRTDRHGRPIRCEECHTQTPGATGYTDHNPPSIATCVNCHDDTDRTPETMRMRICEACHTRKESKLVTLAPRDHLPLTERPLDHTLAFRRDHAESAAQNTVRCATCHTQMSGNPHDACDECHQTMTPADHRITWNEYDHGPEAIATRDRCATCHVPEMCTACHKQRPRSHGSGGNKGFYSDHGEAARINMVACITCHSEQQFCEKCHAAPAGAQRRRK